MAQQLGIARVGWDLWRAQREGPAGLARRRDCRLADLVRHARTCSPFDRAHYRGLPDGTPIADLPPVAKPELMAAWDDWVTDPAVTYDDVHAHAEDPALVGVPFRDGVFVCTGSATTGLPGLFVHGARAVDVYVATVAVRAYLAWLLPSRWLGIARRGPRMAAVIGAGRQFAGASWFERSRLDSRLGAKGIRVLPAQQPLGEIVAALQAFDPTVLAGYPSALELLAQEQVAGRLDLRPLLVAASGESWPLAAQERVAEVFGCPVRESYAASECPFFAFSCGEGWLHHSNDWTMLEPVEADLTPTPPGQASHTVP